MQMMSDHGTQFTSLRREECMEPYLHEFQQWLEKDEIHHMKSRVKHPQSNGKVELGGEILRQLGTAFGIMDRGLNYDIFQRPH